MIANEGDVYASGSTSCIRCDFVGNKLATDWPVLSVRKGFDMDEYPRPTSIRCNKAEALVFVPVGDLALIPHGFAQRGLTSKVTGDRGGGEAPPVGVRVDRPVRHLPP